MKKNRVVFQFGHHGPAAPRPRNLNRTLGAINVLVHEWPHLALDQRASVAARIEEIIHDVRPEVRVHLAQQAKAQGARL